MTENTEDQVPEMSTEEAAAQYGADPLRRGLVAQLAETAGHHLADLTAHGCAPHLVGCAPA